MIASPERNYYTMSEAAVRLGMSSKQVSEMVRHGTIPGIHRVEGSWVVGMEELHAWVNRNLSG
jgi:excisionase family DNA binding protein